MNQINPVPDKKRDDRQSVLSTIRQQRPRLRANFGRRSWRVTLLKRILPGLAILLLIILAIAPSWHPGPESRVTYHISATPTNETSHMEDASYHGRDQQGQPYALTASSVVQQDSSTALLTSLQASIVLKSGAWLMLKSATGTYHQKTDMLDLTGGVTLYRNDGTIITTNSATLNLRTSTAMGTAPVQVSGPFGALQAQNGFTLAAHGEQITFHGPTHMVVNQAQ